jgi:hypothetical protein
LYNIAYSVLVICHMLVAVVLLGTITHQAVSLWWPAPAGTASIALSYRSVRSNLYTTTIIVLFVVVAVMGAFLYPPYRLTVLPFFYANHLKGFGGIFELKEHAVAIGLGLLPIYWLLWRRTPLTDYVQTRKIITAILAVFVWYAFLVGHIINNLKGFGS